MFKEKFEPAPTTEEIEPKPTEIDEFEKKPGLVEVPKPEEERDVVREELKEIPSEEREKIGFGLNNMGFFVDERKNSFFAKVFEGAAKGFDKKSTMGRWLESFSEDYQESAQKTRKKMEQIEKGRKRRFGNITSLAGNVLRYGRVATDIVGYTMGSPFRYVMMAGMFFSRGAEAAKEARLKNEEVIEKTRVHYIDQAAEEAWKIYEQAQVEATEAGQKEVSQKDLEKAYQQNIPEDLLKRIEKKAEPGMATGLLQKTIKWDVEKSIYSIQGKIEKIEKDKKLSAKEKKLQKEKIINKYSKHLNDLDAIVSQYGTVDALAMGARYAKAAAKGVVGAMMVETAGLLVRKVLENLPNIVSTAGAAETAERTYQSPFKVPDEIAAELEKGEIEVPAAKPPTAAELYPDEGAEEKLYPDKGIGAPKEAPITKPEEAYQFPEEVEMVTPERGLAANFTLELGQGEVPSQLERVFHMMAADHMDKVTDASGMFTEEHGAKSLNIAANLVKLAEGRDVAGIDHGDFAKVVSWDAKTNSLEIRDYTQFNQMVDKLEDHADKLWQRDVLQKGAVAYLDDIKKGTWERIIHAQGLDKAGETETGIEGHDEVTADKITDFDKSEMVQEAEKTLEEVKAAVSPEVAEQIDEMVQKEELSPHEAIERAKKIGIAEEPIAGPEAEEKEAIRIREEAEKAAEKLEPLAEAQLDKVRLNLMDTYDMTLGESEAIFSETIGNLLKNTPEDLADIRERFGPDLDLKHDGWFSFGEYKKYCELANDVRTFGPKPEEMDMTVGEFIAKKLSPEFEGAKEEAINIELKKK